MAVGVGVSLVLPQAPKPSAVRIANPKTHETTSRLEVSDSINFGLSILLNIYRLPTFSLKYYMFVQGLDISANLD